jgi:hypothetical protein
LKLTLLSVLSATLLFSYSSYAQIPVVSKVLPKITVGIKAGANFQKLTGSGLWANTYNPGFTGGVFVGVTKKKFGVQVEALISSAKFDYTPQYIAPPPNPPTSANTLNLNVPVLLEYKLVPRLWVQIGPQFSDLLSAKDNNSDVVKNTIKTTDFACVLGLQAILPLHLTVSARYILGLTNVSNLPSDFGTWNNRGIQLTVGYRFL